VLAHQLAELPQRCLRNDRLSVLDQEGRPEEAAMAGELRYGSDSLTEALEGAARFAAGSGRHGADASD
jgi:enoyl-CoA hydratase